MDLKDAGLTESPQDPPVEIEGMEVTEVQTQDGWDWPNGVSHEEWPVQGVEECVDTCDESAGG
jgi:hypothetical protein